VISPAVVANALSSAVTLSTMLANYSSGTFQPFITDIRAVVASLASIIPSVANLIEEVINLLDSSIE
jgi:hypothetical protein